MATNKLLKKGGDIFLPPTSSAPTPQSGAVVSRPKTAIGGLASYMVEESKTQAALDALRIEHAKYVDAIPTRLLDPRSITASQWANRHEDSFKAPEFIQLREEIHNAGGNVQPIKVRPIAANLNAASSVEHDIALSAASVPAEYEIVFGHRRHRACLELGIPVLALIEETTEQRLFVDMDRENRQRADLSPWEQGVMYAKALDKGLFPSNTQLAAAIGRSAGDIGKAIALARLPSPVVQAFLSPLDLQFRWATALNQALLDDPETVIKYAETIAKSKKKSLTSKEIFKILTGEQRFDAEELEAPITTKSRAIEKPQKTIKVGKSGKTVAIVSVDGKGLAHVRIKIELAPERRQALANLIESFLSS